MAFVSYKGSSARYPGIRRDRGRLPPNACPAESTSAGSASFQTSHNERLAVMFNCQVSVGAVAAISSDPKFRCNRGYHQAYMAYLANSARLDTVDIHQSDARNDSAHSLQRCHS
jgi:hypothetical protein